MEFVARRSRESLLAELRDPVEELLPPETAARYEEAVARRARGEPVAYITGVREFWGLSFLVGPGVLVPRPETEVLVEETIRRIREFPEPVGYHDCCTGSGCVAIAVLRECREAGVTIIPGFSDNEERAFAWAEKNAGRLTPETTWDSWIGDGLEILHRPVQVISANPPYLTEEETQDALAEGWGEPPSALTAGVDGLEVYRAIVPQAWDKLDPDGYLIQEIGYDQGDAVAGICRSAGFKNTITVQDISGNDRVVTARK